MTITSRAFAIGTASLVSVVCLAGAVSFAKYIGPVGVAMCLVPLVFTVAGAVLSNRWAPRNEG